MSNEAISNKQVIFIVGRFRSGTSMLWNIFNQLPQYCAWYEPLHPNLLSHINNVKPKKDHIGIDDYWQSYSQLKDLDKYYSARFGQKELYLEKHHNSPDLKKYIQYLIKNSQNKIPVLQFNRCDLRLSWLKNNFPNAIIIHIQREPFSLWNSSRKHIKNDKNRQHESYPDAYDLMQWSVDLAKNFPSLQAQKGRNGYYRHYFIWKLGILLAKGNTDISLNLEQDFFASQKGLAYLSGYFKWNKHECGKVKSLLKTPQSLKQTNKKDKLYLEIEKQVDEEFKQLGLSRLFPSSTLSAIQQEYYNNWSKISYQSDNCIQELLDAMRYQKDELTALLNLE